jgi:hypothetical protein
MATHLRNITERLPRTRASHVGVSIILRAGDIAPKYRQMAVFLDEPGANAHCAGRIFGISKHIAR